MGTTPNLGIEYPDPSGVPSRKSWVEDPMKSADAKVQAALDALFKRGRTPVNIASGANGLATITHTLGRVPVFADAALGTTTYRAAVTATSDTTITVHVVNASTGVNIVGNVIITWLIA